jgi:hypothetical protein
MQEFVNLVEKFIMIRFLSFLIFVLPLSGFAQPDCKVLMEGISQVYDGDCRRNLAHGEGIARGIDYYEGEFRRGLPHGEGVYIWENGDTYAGDWRNGQRHGIGKFTIAEIDSSYIGQWKRDEFIRALDTLPKELASYEIYYRRNLTRTRFVRTGDGNKVLFNYSDAAGNRQISTLNTFGTSGFMINYSRHFGYENVEFPFEGKISFMAPSRTGMVIYQIELHFVINEPGLWEIYLGF